MTTSDTLYRAEQLFEEELKKKTNWGRNELLQVFQACLRKALGEHLDAYEAKDDNEGDIRPKGSGNIELGHSDPSKQDRFKKFLNMEGDAGKIVYCDHHDEGSPLDDRGLHGKDPFVKGEEPYVDDDDKPF